MSREFRRVRIRHADVAGPGMWGVRGKVQKWRDPQPHTMEEALMSVVLGRPFPTNAEREEWGLMSVPGR